MKNPDFRSGHSSPKRHTFELLRKTGGKPSTGRHLPLRLSRLSVAFGLPSSLSGLALSLCCLVLCFLVVVLSFLSLVRFAFVIFVLPLSCLRFVFSWLVLFFWSGSGLRLVLVSACCLASRLVLSCCVSCLVFVLCCLVLPLSLSLFCLICVVLVFLLCCAVCLSSWVALSTHFWPVWVVLGVDVGHFGSSWGALGSVLGSLLGVLGGLGGAWNGLESG